MSNLHINTYMKFYINKYLALGAIGLSSVFFVSCDDSSSSGSGRPSGGEPTITFPKEFQAGDAILLDGIQSWTFNGPDTFDWDGSAYTLGSYRPKSSQSLVLLKDIEIPEEEAEMAYQERIDELLEDFESILRTIPLERVLADEELTLDDLRAFEELINAEVGETGQVIVFLDEQNVRLILNVSYDMTLFVTSGVDSFIVGEYSGNYEAIQTGNVIKFKTPTSTERDSYRMTSDHRLPKVTSSKASLDELYVGDFVWTLSSVAPPEKADPVEPEETP